MAGSFNKGGRIILNEDKPDERSRLVDAYGVEIGPEEEPYIPCLDGTDYGPPRTRILGVPQEEKHGV